MPDADYAEQSRLNRARSKHVKKLDLLMENPYDQELGMLRNILAPVDTAAFPPEALSTPVSTFEDYLEREGVAGRYIPSTKQILLNPNMAGHRGRGVYQTLLHEAAHARDYHKHLRGISEEVAADVLADSILRGYPRQMSFRDRIDEYWGDKVVPVFSPMRKHLLENK